MRKKIYIDLLDDLSIKGVGVGKYSVIEATQRESEKKQDVKPIIHKNITFHVKK